MKPIAIKSLFPVKQVKLIYKETQPEKKIKYNDELLGIVLEKEKSKLQAEFAQKLQQEKQNSFNEGYKKGNQDIEKKYFNEFNKSFNILKNISVKLNSVMTETIEQEEQEILKLVLNIARKVVSTELMLNPDIVLGVLKNSLNLLNERRTIKIYTNPQDWTTVKNSIQHLDLKVELPENVEILNSVNISQGGCKIESQSGSIDADIETQFAEITRKLLKDED